MPSLKVGIVAYSSFISATLMGPENTTKREVGSVIWTVVILLEVDSYCFLRTCEH